MGQNNQPANQVALIASNKGSLESLLQEIWLIGLTPFCKKRRIFLNPKLGMTEENDFKIALVL